MSSNKYIHHSSSYATMERLNLLNTERSDLLELISIHQQNLRILHTQKAKFGLEVPLHILHGIDLQKQEMERIYKQINEIEQAISQLSIILERSIEPFAYLLLIKEGKVVESIDLLRDETTIGRHQCNIAVPKEFTKVSNRHARIVYHVSGVFIEDLGSSHGTYVDGVRIDRPISLQPGQQITLGGRRPHEQVYVLEFSLEPLIVPTDRSSISDSGLKSKD